jgi:hypothetical protein
MQRARIVRPTRFTVAELDALLAHHRERERVRNPR